MEDEPMTLQIAEEGEPLSEGGLLGLGSDRHGRFSMVQGLLFRHTDPETDQE